MKEKQCLVANAYCNERSMTCQCKHGYELDIDLVDDEKANETQQIGKCVPIEGSQWRNFEQEVNDDDDYFGGADDILFQVEAI